LGSVPEGLAEPGCPRPSIGGRTVIGRASGERPATIVSFKLEIPLSPGGVSGGGGFSRTYR
jgi:hypothetical protein